MIIKGERLYFHQGTSKTYNYCMCAQRRSSDYAFAQSDQNVRRSHIILFTYKDPSLLVHADSEGSDETAQADLHL